MKLIPVETMPGRAYPQCNLQAMIDEFAEMEADIVRIDTEDHYASIRVAYSVIHVACKRSRHPVTCAMRGSNIFLIKKT